MAIMDSIKGSSLTDVPCALREARMLSRSARCRLHLTQVGLSSRKEAAIFSAFSFPNSFSHMAFHEAVEKCPDDSHHIKRTVKEQCGKHKQRYDSNMFISSGHMISPSDRALSGMRALSAAPSHTEINLCYFAKSFCAWASISAAACSGVVVRPKRSYVVCLCRFPNSVGRNWS